MKTTRNTPHACQEQAVQPEMQLGDNLLAALEDLYVSTLRFESICLKELDKLNDNRWQEALVAKVIDSAKGEL